MDWLTRRLTTLVHSFAHSLHTTGAQRKWRPARVADSRTRETSGGFYSSFFLCLVTQPSLPDQDLTVILPLPPGGTTWQLVRMCVPSSPSRYHAQPRKVLCFKLYEPCVTTALIFRRPAGASLPVRQDASNVAKVSLTDSYQTFMNRIVVCSLLFWCLHCSATWWPIGFSKVPSRLS
jgi:hypothetical protein